MNRITEELRVIQTLRIGVLAGISSSPRYRPTSVSRAILGERGTISPHIDGGVECGLGSFLLLGGRVDGGQSLAGSLARGADLLAVGAHGEGTSLIGEKLSEFKGPGPGQASLAKRGGSHEG